MNAGITSLVLSYPEQIRRNSYWHERYPAVVAAAQQKTLDRLWRTRAGTGQAADAFEAELTPYLEDPFRGTRERRVLGPGEGALTLELRAARDAMALERAAAQNVGVLIAASFLPDSLGVGNAAYLSAELGLRCAAFNVESACSGSLVALQTAVALVASGQYPNALVVVSCNYSRAADESDTLSWTVGDGAAAYWVAPVEDGFGLLGCDLVNTSSSCGAMYYEIATDGPPRLRMRADPKKAPHSLRQISEDCLLPCVERALRKADVAQSEIDFFVFNTPVAWYAAFCARALGVPRNRTIDCYPLYANVGPVLMPSNLFHAAHSKRIRRGDLVLLYTVGSVSSAGAGVVRWGDVGLGRSPSPDAP